LPFALPPPGARTPGAAPLAAPFLEAALSTPELLCPDVHEQLAALSALWAVPPAGVAPGAARRPTRPGDWFLTAHSNLPGAHLIFHLAVLAAQASDFPAAATRSEGEKDGGADAEADALAGIAAILAAAGAAGASGVAVPLLLDPPDGSLAADPAGKSQPTAGTFRPCARRAAGGR
jgi:hypothetical protein